jgi:peptide deformylase
VELRHYPDRVLKRKAQAIREVTDRVAEQARQMLDLMYESDGVGLAAPQVGWSRRLVTLDAEGTHEGQRVFLNPIIVRREGELEHDEGCLSLPGVQLKVPRAEKVSVVAYTLEGERVELEAEGLLSCIWQHELDHLNGLLIIDKVAPTALLAIREHLKELERDAQTTLKHEGQREHEERRRGR